jgi:hypothetical protein
MSLNVRSDAVQGGGEIPITLFQKWMEEKSECQAKLILANEKIAYLAVKLAESKEKEIVKCKFNCVCISFSI